MCPDIFVGYHARFRILEFPGPERISGTGHVTRFALVPLEQIREELASPVRNSRLSSMN